MRSRVGLAALTVLDCPPEMQLELAEHIGFDSVGLRLLPAVPGTVAYPLHDQPAALRRLLARLKCSPVSVFDVEIIRLGPAFTLESIFPVLDAAAVLGARAILVGGDDPVLSPLTASYGRLAEACAERGLVASLEFMPWTAVPNARAAVHVVSQADPPGRSVLVDALHAARSETTLEDIASIPPAWLHYAQICDGFAAVPARKAELVRQAREERLVPGEGGIDVTGICSALPVGLPVSVELPNEAQRSRYGTEPWLRHVLARARAVVEAGRRPC